MNKPQWITAGAALLLAIGIYAATQEQVFGSRIIKRSAPAAQGNASTLSIDSLVLHAKTHLAPEQATRLSFLESSITRGDVKEQRLHIFHQLARFWHDTVQVIEPKEWFLPYAWYTAEAARLENSEKSLTFAAHLLLNNLPQEPDPASKQWQAFQAKDLFERSLKVNPVNDSTKVGLGAVYLYGGIASPMEGINLIKEVADRDSTDVYAQTTLGEASLMSGQLDKALERFINVVKLQPDNLGAIFRVAETSEQLGKNEEAIVWYTRLLPSILNPSIKKEVEARIARLKK